MHTELDSEIAEADHIKSKQTRQRVQSALRRIRSTVDHVPENGLLVFSGNDDITVIEPPFPVQENIYHCDSSFYLDGLLSPLDGPAVGVLVTDRTRATLGRIQGDQVIEDTTIDSNVRSKHGMGGQSQQRFERSIEEEYHEHLKKAGQLVDRLDRDELEGLIVAGPGYAKKDLIDRDLLPHDVTVLATTRTGYAGPQGLREVPQRIPALLAELGLGEKKQAFQRFLKQLKTDEAVAYGREQVEHALELKAVDSLLITEDHAELADLCEQQGGESHVFWGETEEGERLSNVFGGVAAVLRWPVRNVEKG